MVSSDILYCCEPSSWNTKVIDLIHCWAIQWLPRAFMYPFVHEHATTDLQVVVATETEQSLAVICMLSQCFLPNNILKSSYIRTNLRIIVTHQDLHVVTVCTGQGVFQGTSESYAGCCSPVTSTTTSRLQAWQILYWSDLYLKADNWESDRRIVIVNFIDFRKAFDSISVWVLEQP